ncbi:Basic leucine zipper and W2 domain-containing protein 1-A [Porphyridium purpureum]|uniref:Basic leucine zipper and W2 domain-containing protein 1-A n=1 Tax=Porphyridium purpureum TaxID=35688 RepID=A0A5J4YT17_PORPP|nr:Basic leucine zipper and W2 domain-containing protein 1-A [Porphyridium purpureum]|eukprot:POR0483..scf227_4
MSSGYAGVPGAPGAPGVPGAPGAPGVPGAPGPGGVGVVGVVAKAAPSAAKEQKPTLGGAPNIKTRKRNITTKHDPEAFRDALGEVLDEIEQLSDIKRAVTMLDKETFDYSRYGEVFAECMLAGNIVEPGGSLRGVPFQMCVFEAASSEQVAQVVELLAQMMRRKPFLRARYDAVVQKLQLFLSSYSERNRLNFGSVVGLMMAKSMLTPSVLREIQSDANVEGHFALDHVSAVIKTYMSENDGNVEKLNNLLRVAGLDMEFMVGLLPSKIRSPEELSAYFHRLGLDQLVQENEKRLHQLKVTEVRNGVTERINEGLSPAEIVAFVDAKCEESKVSQVDRVVAVWNGLLDTVDMDRKVQQNRVALLAALTQHHRTLYTACKNGKDEMVLMVQIQHFVSNDMELLKAGVFRDIAYVLYMKDVFSEDTILRWHRRGTTLVKGSAASSNIIREQMQPFIEWLETAEEMTAEEAALVMSASAAPASDSAAASSSSAAAAAEATA